MYYTSLFIQMAVAYNSIHIINFVIISFDKIFTTNSSLFAYNICQFSKR